MNPRESRPEGRHPEHLRAQTTKGIVAQATDHDADGALTLAAELPDNWIIHGVERAAEVAFEHNIAVVFVGRRNDGKLRLCVDWHCCGTVPGAYTVLPDVMLAEYYATHGEDAQPDWIFTRHDGRSAGVWLVPEAGGGDE